MAARPQLVRKGESAKTDRRARTSGIDRALQVLDHLQETGSPAGAYAIAKAIGAPQSTVYVIIDDLVAKNLLQARRHALAGAEALPLRSRLCPVPRLSRPGHPRDARALP